MTTPRVGCAARALYRDQHQCVESWGVVRTPNGNQYDFCSACCVLEFICLAGLPADVEASRREGEAA
jgi:hypothetical protein